MVLYIVNIKKMEVNYGLTLYLIVKKYRSVILRIILQCPPGKSGKSYLL